jgi:hypothetical protein
MLPPDGEQGRANLVVVPSPRGRIDVVVVSREASHPEVDGPATEQPIVESGGSERLIEARDSVELVSCLASRVSRHHPIMSTERFGRHPGNYCGLSAPDGGHRTANGPLISIPVPPSPQA